MRGVVVFLSCILGCLSSLLQPYSFLCTNHTSLPRLLLRCLYTTPGKGHASRNLLGRGPHLSLAMWSTLTYAFTVPTSSARSVNSSGHSLTVTSWHPSGTFGLRTLSVPLPWFKYPTSKAHLFSILLINSRRPSVRPFLLSLPRSFTMSCKRPSPSSC